MNVQKAAAIGVVSGVGNNRFDPDAQLTREQAATFADNDSVSSWALEQVGHVQAAGIMSGTGGNMFSPKQPYTREQSIVTILRLFDLVK